MDSGRIVKRLSNERLIMMFPVNEITTNIVDESNEQKQVLRSIMVSYGGMVKDSSDGGQDKE